MIPPLKSCNGGTNMKNTFGDNTCCALCNRCGVPGGGGHASRAFTTYSENPLYAIFLCKLK